MFRRGGPNLTQDAGQVLSIEIEDRLSTVPDNRVDPRIAFDLHALAGDVDEVVVSTADDNVVTTARDDLISTTQSGCDAFDGLNNFVLVIEEEGLATITEHDIPTVIGPGIDIVSTGTPDHDVKASIRPDLVGSTMEVKERPDFR